MFQGVTSGSAELREQAAQGLGELIEVTSEQVVKEFVIPITGYVQWLFISYQPGYNNLVYSFLQVAGKKVHW